MLHRSKEVRNHTALFSHLLMHPNPSGDNLYEHGYFSFCLFKCRLVDFSQVQNQILRLQDKLSPVSNMASSRSEENVNLRHFPTQDGVTVLVSPAILLDSYDLLLLWQMFKPIFYGIVILLADVIALLP